ncbi:DNA-directed RNA polymerase subunit alpha [Candidatus Babeliales bacterium]|nr:DNA-directed RNA polymerase subunit alpha [Candidatus Babeliales bacterium]
MNKLEYKPLTLPKLQWTKKTISDTYGELVAQPLEPGFGMTLGSALRRVLLGAVEGSAVTSVVIKGVNNEFSSIPGVVEDTMQLILNLKEIVIRNRTGKTGRMRLQISGESTVRVGDIKADEHLELINTDHVIAHVAAGGELDVDFFVESGRGYQPAQWPADTALQPDGRIYLDAMFSPIKKVAFEVEKTRVGGTIDYDKLSLYIHTDGAENPLDVLHYAVSVLRTQLEHFLASAEIPFNELSQPEVVEEAASTQEIQESPLRGLPIDLLLKPIDELELSVRAHNCLVNAGIKRVVDLVNLSDDDVMKIKNFGRKSAKEVADALTNLGLSFNMNIQDGDLQKALVEKDEEKKV